MRSGVLVGLARHDVRARLLLERFARNLGLGLATLVHVVAPAVIVLHGDVVDGGEDLRAAVERATRAEVLAEFREMVWVELSRLDSRAVLLGAAGLVLPQRFDLRI